MCSRPRSPFGDGDPDTQTPVMKFYHSMSSDTLGCLSKDRIIIDSKGRPCVSVFIFQPRVWRLYLHSMGQHPRITPHPGNRSLSVTERDTLYQRVCVCVCETRCGGCHTGDTCKSETDVLTSESKKRARQRENLPNLLDLFHVSI